MDEGFNRGNLSHDGLDISMQAVLGEREAGSGFVSCQQKLHGQLEVGTDVYYTKNACGREDGREMEGLNRRDGERLDERHQFGWSPKAMG